MPRAEQCWPSSGHDTPYQIRSTPFATEPYDLTTSQTASDCPRRRPALEITRCL
jgi:hypothetical protein